MLNRKDNFTIEQQQLPLSKSATLALAQLDKLIHEIHEAFLKAFHPAGEEAHDAKLIYVKIFEILKIWFTHEATSDAMSKSIHRDSDGGISIKSIKKFFHFTKISLQEGQYDSFDIKNSKYSSLSERKQNLLMRIIDTYEQLAFFKFLMTNLLAPEFVKAEEEIQEINYENIQHRYNRQSPDTPKFTTISSLYSIDQHDNEALQCDERICRIYANLVKTNLHSYYEILDVYGNFGNEIKKVRSAIQLDLDRIDGAIQEHNHVTTLIKNRDDIKVKISQISFTISSHLKNLKELDNDKIIANEEYLETQLPSYINQLKNELSGFIKEDEALVAKYNDDVTHLVALRDEGVLNAIANRDKLYELLAALPVLPDITLPPHFNELLRSGAHKEYERLNAEIKVLQKQKRNLDIEIKAIGDAWARINEIREKSHLIAERVAIFHKLQLEILQDVQRNINIISTDLFSLCEDQSTVKHTLTFDGFMPTWVETEGYKYWKNVANLVATGLQSIYRISSNISAEFEKLGDGSAKQQEGEAISSFIISKRDEVEGSLRIRLESSRLQSSEIEIKINEIQHNLLTIQTDLNVKLQSIYQNGCSQKNSLDQTIELDRARFKRHIDVIETASANQFEIKAATKDSVIIKEHSHALDKIEELESCLQEKRSKLHKARLGATESFFLISGIVNKIKNYHSVLCQMRLNGFPLDNYGLFEQEYLTLESEFEAAFKKYNVLCGPGFLPRYQLLEKKLIHAIEEAKSNRELQDQKNEKSLHEKGKQTNDAVTTSKVHQRLGVKRQNIPPKKNNPDDGSDDVSKTKKSIRKKEEPSFWDRHKCKIMLGLSGFAAGAAGGAVAGVYLAPVTWGLSVPILGLIFGIAGAIAGLLGGIAAGSAIDCCLQPNVEDDEPELSVDKEEPKLSSNNKGRALSINHNEHQNAKINQERSVMRSLPRNIAAINQYTQGSSRHASSSSTPTLFQSAVKAEKSVESVSTLTQDSYVSEGGIIVSPRFNQQST